MLRRNAPGRRFCSWLRFRRAGARPLALIEFAGAALRLVLVWAPTFMAEAAKLLRGDDLIAAIPKRGWLLVGRCRAGELPVMMQFRQMAEGIGGRGGRHALTAACFSVRGGELRGISGDGYLSLVTDPDNPWNA
jgi:hypothetical protein